LIKRSSPRIRKDLRAHNPIQLHIKIVEISPETVASCSATRIGIITSNLRFSAHQLLNRTDSSDARQPSSSPEITTIHKAKGREWEKVILIHNTLERRFPRRDSELTEERRVFYVAMRRAKVELVVLGGRCPFVPEFEKIEENLGYYLRQFAYWRARRKIKKQGDAK